MIEGRWCKKHNSAMVFQWTYGFYRMHEIHGAPWQWQGTMRREYLEPTPF